MMSVVMEFSVRTLCLVMVAFAVHVVLWNDGVCCGEPKTSLVTGMVFCDQCLLGTLSALSQPLAGAQVSLECYRGSTTAAFWASTDENGVFSISVEEDDFQIHGDGRCTVKIVKSTDMDCYIPTDIANGSSGATISSAGGIYRERSVYYVGPFAYRMSRPAKSCNALQLGSRHGITLESSELPLQSLGASSRGLKAVGRSFAEAMSTVPSSASTIPPAATSAAKPPSYSIPVTRPTPAHGDHSRVKHSGVPTSTNHSPTKCIPLPPVPLDPKLITKLHYPPCKDEPPTGEGGTPPPSIPLASPIGPGSPFLPPTASPPKVGSAPPKANSPSYSGSPKPKLPLFPSLSPPLPTSPSYGGSPIPKLPRSPQLSPPPPTSGSKPAPPSPTTPSPPSPPHKHPIHRPHPHHRPSPLAPPPTTNPGTPIRHPSLPPYKNPLAPPPPPTNAESPISHPSPPPYKNPPPPSGSQLRYPLPPPSYVKPSPPLTPPPQPPSTPKMPPHHHQTPHHIPPPQPPSTIPLPFPHPPPPF